MLESIEHNASIIIEEYLNHTTNPAEILDGQNIYHRKRLIYSYGTVNNSLRQLTVLLEYNRSFLSHAF